MRALSALLCLVAFGLSGTAVHAAQRQDPVRIALDDIGTRLQFAFYTGDTAALRRELASLSTLEVPASLGSLQQAYAGFGAWKLAELLRATDPAAATGAARECIATLEKAGQAEPKRAALLAMLSLCQRLTAGVQGRLQAPLSTSRSRQSLERAVALAPRDAHVRLADAILEYERAVEERGELAAARVRFEGVASAFETRSSSAGDDLFANAFSWGEAETQHYLGRIHLAQGNIAGARDAFERALVLAGEYRAAEESLRTLAVPPRP